MVSRMDRTATWRSGGRSSYERLAAIVLAMLAVLSPLYMDRRPAVDPELEEQTFSTFLFLPLLLLVLIIAIVLSCYFDPSFTRFDSNWIHRVGGSSTGIFMLLLVLALVLKCKASAESLEA